MGWLEEMTSDKPRTWPKYTQIRSKDGWFAAEAFFGLGGLLVTKLSLGAGPNGLNPVFGEEFVITHEATGYTVMARIATFKKFDFAKLAVERIAPLADWPKLREPTRELQSKVLAALLAVQQEERKALEAARA